MRLNDINISISKDKLQAGVIFLAGFAAGLGSFALIFKNQVEKKFEQKAKDRLENTLRGVQDTLNGTYYALERTDEKAKMLEKAIEDYDRNKK